MRFCCASETAVSGLYSDCFFRGPKILQRFVANFYSLFYFDEVIASGKHVVQTAAQSAQAGETVDLKRSKKMADSSIRTSLLFFRFTLLRKFQIPCESSRGKQFVLALGA